MRTLSFLVILTITKSSPDAKSEARISSSKDKINVCFWKFLHKNPFLSYLVMVGTMHTNITIIHCPLFCQPLIFIPVFPCLSSTPPSFIWDFCYFQACTRWDWMLTVQRTRTVILHHYHSKAGCDWCLLSVSQYVEYSNGSLSYAIWLPLPWAVW